MKMESKKSLIIAAVLASGVMGSVKTQATTITAPVTWGLGDMAGTSATTCSFTYSDLMPLSQPRTLLVDNHLANGSVLYSWSYSDFIPSVILKCNTGSSNSIGYNMSPPTAITLNSPIGLYNYNAVSTNISGIGIRYYVKYTRTGGYCATCSSSQSNQANGFLYSHAGGVPPPTLNTEYIALNGPNGNYYSVGLGVNPLKQAASPNRYFYDTTYSFIELSIRADLIKTGAISYTSPPLITPTISTRGLTTVNLDVGANGVTIVPPTCKLTSQDHKINLGRWVDRGPGSSSPTSLPATGATVPVPLDIECTGQVNNLRFKFDNAFGTPMWTASKNIPVYTTATGGRRIDGLEIEMLYNDAPVKLGDVISTGSRGTTKTNPQDFSYNAAGTLPFAARFIQTSAINYTGPLTGKVNMWVTYD